MRRPDPPRPSLHPSLHHLSGAPAASEPPQPGQHWGHTPATGEPTSGHIISDTRWDRHVYDDDEDDGGRRCPHLPPRSGPLNVSPCFPGGTTTQQRTRSREIIGQNQTTVLLTVFLTTRFVTCRFGNDLAFFYQFMETMSPHSWSVHNNITNCEAVQWALHR